MIENILARLKKVRAGSKSRWSATCPVHKGIDGGDEKKESLSIRIGDNGAILLKCHSPGNCNWKAIIAALGLETKDLFPPQSSRKAMSESTFKKAYDYRDSDGKLMYQVCRFEPKRFTQRRPNPAFDPKLPRDKDTNPEYLYNLEGVERTIYRLPQVLSAMKKNPERFCFVMEGEVDVDLAWENGMVATCNSGGALKWEAVFGGFFKGWNVVVIPDNDPVDSQMGFSPGRRHADEVAASLHGIAKVVRVVDLPGVPPKGDFRDWWQAFDEAKTPTAERKEKLAALIKATPLWTPPKVDEKPAAPVEEKKLASTEMPPPSVEWERVLAEFFHFHTTNHRANASATSAEWLGNFYANRLALESLYQNAGKYESVKEITFLLCSQLLAGLPVACK